MPVNWQDKAVQDRLLTAVIASIDNKVSRPLTPQIPHMTSHTNTSLQINCKEVARFCGADMTYNAVESYLRKFRAEAKVMLGKTPAATSSPVKPTATPKKGRTASPTKGSVKSGRVEKKKPTTPKVKKEVVEAEAAEMLRDDGAGEEDESETEI